MNRHKRYPPEVRERAGEAHRQCPHSCFDARNLDFSVLGLQQFKAFGQ